MKIEINFKQLVYLLRQLARLQSFLITLALLAIFGYTARQLSQIPSTLPDQAYVQKQEQAQAAGQTKIDIKTLNALSSQQVVNGQTGVAASGKSDPFSP